MCMSDQIKKAVISPATGVVVSIATLITLLSSVMYISAKAWSYLEVVDWLVNWQKQTITDIKEIKEDVADVKIDIARLQENILKKN